MRLTWASQVAYECFFFSPAGPALVTKTDTWIRTLLTTRNETNLPLGGSFYAARPTQRLLKKCFLFSVQQEAPQLLLYLADDIVWLQLWYMGFNSADRQEKVAIEITCVIEVI